MIFSKDLGKQINLMLTLGVISTVLYLIITKLLPVSCLREIARGVFLFEAALYYGFTLILFKKWVEKTYD